MPDEHGRRTIVRRVGAASVAVGGVGVLSGTAAADCGTNYAVVIEGEPDGVYIFEVPTDCPNSEVVLNYGGDGDEQKTDFGTKVLCDGEPGADEYDEWYIYDASGEPTVEGEYKCTVTVTCD
ncbi:MAG: hypothetical protein ABEI99_06455 [Halobaculum sp.]